MKTMANTHKENDCLKKRYHLILAVRKVYNKRNTTGKD